MQRFIVLAYLVFELAGGGGRVVEGGYVTTNTLVF